MKVQKKESQVNTEMTATLMIDRVKYFLMFNNLVFLEKFFEINIYRKETRWFCEKLHYYLIMNNKMIHDKAYMKKLKYLLNLKIYKLENKVSFNMGLYFERELKQIEDKLKNLITNKKHIEYEEF